MCLDSTQDPSNRAELRPESVLSPQNSCPISSHQPSRLRSGSGRGARLAGSGSKAPGSPSEPGGDPQLLPHLLRRGGPGSLGYRPSSKLPTALQLVGGPCGRKPAPSCFVPSAPSSVRSKLNRGSQTGHSAVWLDGSPQSPGAHLACAGYTYVCARAHRPCWHDALHACGGETGTCCRVVSGTRSPPLAPATKAEVAAAPTGL